MNHSTLLNALKIVIYAITIPVVINDCMRSYDGAVLYWVEMPKLYLKYFIKHVHYLRDMRQRATVGKLD